MRWQDLSEENCPVARGLSVIGERWTILILRDCFMGFRRFEQFQSRIGVTRHVLADRLRKLEAAGVLRREPYQERPLRYEYRLTDMGKDLHSVVVALVDWANRHVPSDGPPPFEIVSRDTGEAIQPVLIDGRSGSPITHRSVTARGLDTGRESGDGEAAEREPEKRCQGRGAE